MRPAAWRAVILMLCAVGALFTVASFVDQTGLGGLPWYGVWGGYFDGSAEPYRMTFRGVDPGGPADRAGPREGDLVDVRANTPRERLSMVGQPLAGERVTFRVQRGSLRTSATVVPESLNLSRFWNYFFWEFTNLWLLLFAAVIAWRRPYADNNLLLAAVLVCAAIGFSAESVFWGLPSAWAYVALAVIGQVLPLSVALWAALAASFARPLSRVRRFALGLCYTFVAVAILTGDGTPDRAVGIAPLVATMTMWFDPTRFVGVIWTAPFIAASLTAILCGILTIAAARGVDRQRAMWLLGPLAAFYSILAASSVALHLLNYAAILVLGRVYGIVAIVTPLALTYVALNRRLIDIGFVLNRAVVFAVVSSIVIGAFVLVEWAVGAWLVTASHATNVIAGMAVALVLGLSLRYIHGYVDRVVDRVLFSKRHAGESALRQFAHEASYITDAATLLERAVRTVREHTDAEYANIIVRDGSAMYVSTTGERFEVEENDPALVALGAWNKPVDLDEMHASELPGELAFPMISRGRLVGALLCGEKTDGEGYAPDESDALLVLARAVGSALDVLDAKGERTSDPALAEISESIRTLTEVARSLPDAIAERLREGPGVG